jgi:hypothetical protein
MAECFDAFLYFANWGTHRLMFRLPRSGLDAKAVKPYCTDTQVGATRAGECTVLDFWSPEDTRDDEWREWRLGTLLPLRSDLMAGDLRCLYLAWLSAVQGYDVEPDNLEPPVPPGLKELSGTLIAFAEFLYLDVDLIAIAAEASAKAAAGPSAAELAAWVASAPDEQKNEWLVRVMREKGAGLRTEMLTQFRLSRKPKRVKTDERERRTAGALREAWEAKQPNDGDEDV